MQSLGYTARSLMNEAQVAEGDKEDEAFAGRVKDLMGHGRRPGSWTTRNTN